MFEIDTSLLVTRYFKLNSRVKDQESYFPLSKCLYTINKTNNNNNNLRAVMFDIYNNNETFNIKTRLPITVLGNEAWTSWQKHKQLAFTINDRM